ncbi:hypothetical protein SCAR479_13005 [Seiridium cardinale]|uniref:Nudix hydrolase domain-containing protein n=1 Tax=Seiridium cardinale TaxID=138064 RepID=A0ABR2X993_9PEZI
MSPPVRTKGREVARAVAASGNVTRRPTQRGAPAKDLHRIPDDKLEEFLALTAVDIKRKLRARNQNLSETGAKVELYLRLLESHRLEEHVRRRNDEAAAATLASRDAIMREMNDEIHRQGAFGAARTLFVPPSPVAASPHSSASSSPLSSPSPANSPLQPPVVSQLPAPQQPNAPLPPGPQQQNAPFPPAPQQPNAPFPPAPQQPNAPLPPAQLPSPNPPARPRPRFQLPPAQLPPAFQRPPSPVQQTPVQPAQTPPHVQQPAAASAWGSALPVTGQGLDALFDPQVSNFFSGPSQAGAGGLSGLGPTQSSQAGNVGGFFGPSISQPPVPTIVVTPQSPQSTGLVSPPLTPAPAPAPALQPKPAFAGWGPVLTGGRRQCPARDCPHGSHLGHNGAAGVVLIRRDPQTEAPTHIVLQERNSGEWTIPGGLLDEAKDDVRYPIYGALREAEEESGVDRYMVDVRTDPGPLAYVWSVCNHWRYTTFFGDILDANWQPRVADSESRSMVFIPIHEVDQGRVLLPAFQESWPAIRAMIPDRFQNEWAAGHFRSSASTR